MIKKCKVWCWKRLICKKKCLFMKKGGSSVSSSVLWLKKRKKLSQLIPFVLNNCISVDNKLGISKHGLINAICPACLMLNDQRYNNILCHNISQYKNVTICMIDGDNIVYNKELCNLMDRSLTFWRHPFTAEDPLVSKWKSVLLKKQTHLHLGWFEEEEFLANLELFL